MGSIEMRKIKSREAIYLVFSERKEKSIKLMLKTVNSNFLGIDYRSTSKSKSWTP